MHFGQTTEDVPHQIAMMHDSLDQFTEFSRHTHAQGIAEWIRAWVIERAGEDAVDYYWRAGPFEGALGQGSTATGRGSTSKVESSVLG